MQAEHLSDYVIANLRRELRQFATAGKLSDPPGAPSTIDPFGVRVLYSKVNHHLVRFEGCTHDDVVWDATVDFRAYNRSYHDLVIQGVKEGITLRRRERQGKGPIILPGDFTQLH